MNISKALGTGIPRAFKTRRFRNMSREEILEKLPEDLKAMLHYMDCCFDEYILTNKEKTLEVKRCYEEYTLEVLS